MIRRCLRHAQSATDSICAGPASHKSSWPHFCVRQRRLREKRTWLNKEKQSSEQGLGRRSNSTRRYLSTPFGSTKPRTVR